MICRNCAHAYSHPDTVRMQKLGFRNCRHLPVWHVVSGSNQCGIGKFEEEKKN